MKPGDYVLWYPGNVAGVISKLHDPGTYKPKNAPDCLTSPVVEFLDGNAFVHTPENFTILSENEYRFFLQGVELCNQITKGLVQLGAAMKIEPLRGIRLITAIVSSVTNALGRN